MADKPPPRIQLASNAADLRDAIRRARVAGKSIGFVPTMGALHEGHLSLVRRSVTSCDFTVASIFVNPTQFGPHEDFSRYPRTLATDLAMLEQERADLVFAPAADTVYPEGFSTYVDPPAVAQPLEGECRPGHFRGVATIVLKLFNLVCADVAFFGQKDFQQSRVIQDMVRDLDLSLRIEICPIVREADGLAMSSRNRYLSDEERQRALSLYRALQRAEELIHQGQRHGPIVCDEMRRVLVDGGVTDIDYATVVEPSSLQATATIDQGAVALIAAHVGKTRLIDNCIIP